MNRRHFFFTTAAATAASSFTFAAEEKKPWRVVVMGNKGSYGHSLDSMWLKVPGTEIVAAM